MMLVPIPAWMRERVRETHEPAPTKDAATIAVVRDGADGLEVFLMRRQATMAFAAGMYVFPGGGVFDEDEMQIPWIGPDASAFAARFNTSAELAHALVVAAVRETFEETGVLLAGPDEDSVVADVSVFHDARLAIERHELSFAEFLHQHRLHLRADLLGPWSHWITPAFEPRRFDTRFFVSALPHGQRIDRVSDEADESMWLPISEVLASVQQGTVAMMPPTSITCTELLPETSSTVLTTAQRRIIQPIEPRVVEVDGELWFETGREGPA